LHRDRKNLLNGSLRYERMCQRLRHSAADRGGMLLTAAAATFGRSTEPRCVLAPFHSGKGDICV
jgi:hypothetical protein